MVNFRKATEKDIDKITNIYEEIHTDEEKGYAVIGWIRNVYPTRKTAEDALKRNDLFVAEVENVIVGAAVINKIQMDEYQYGNWQYEADDKEVMVLHTLVISPKIAGSGYGRAFVDFYENYARTCNCLYLRIDTNEKNVRAREMYKKLGFFEVGIIPCDFNGIRNVKMVLLEKKLY